MFVHQKDKQGNVQDPQNATHYLMDGCRGGVVIIGWTDYPQAMEEYAKSIDAGFKIFMIEKRTKIFRSLADIDYTGVRKLSGQEELSVFVHIQNSHKLFYPEWNYDVQGDTFQMFVLSTSTDLIEPKDPSEAPKYKSGNHLIFVNLFLDDSQADWIHKSCVVKAKQRWSDAKCFGIHDEWDKIIDRSVIDSNGLRMVGANKQKKCPTCKGAKSKLEDCSDCNFSGKLDIKRPYELKYILNSRGQRCADDEDYYKSNFAALVKRVSIRTNNDATSPGFKPYAGAPSCTPHTLQMDIHGKLVSVSQGFTEDNKAQSRMKEKIRLISTDPILPHLLKAARKYAHEYRNVDLAAVYTNERKDAYRINLAGVGSQTCGNLIGRDHHNNSCYIYMEKKELATTTEQRCYCQCKVTTGRIKSGKLGISVFCSKYRGDKKRMSEEESDDCFPTFLTKTSSIMKNGIKSVFHFDPNPNGRWITLNRIVRAVGAKVMEDLSGESTQQQSNAQNGGGNKATKRKRAAPKVIASVGDDETAPKKKKPASKKKAKNDIDAEATDLPPWANLN